MRRPLWAAGWCALAGCTTVGPDYVRPLTAMPAAFVNPGTAASAAFDLLQHHGPFWHQFQDPVLDALVEAAITANHDVRMATARLREARGLRSEARGGLHPAVNASASAQHGRVSESQAPGLSEAERTGSRFEGGFDAAWEIDLFGGTRRSVEAASAGAQATEAELAGVRLSVAAEVALTYISLRGQQQRLQVARESLRNQQKTLQVLEARWNAGRGTEFDVARIRGLVENTRAALPALQAGAATDAYALALLAGQAPGSMQTLEQSAPVVPRTPLFAVSSDPAVLMRRRPDVRAAEQRLAASTAAIGAHVAQLFPSVTLTGFVGVQALHAGDLLHAGALTYGAGPGVRWNLLDFGRIRARIEQADARAEAALAAYEKTVLQALHDAEAALQQLHRATQRSGSLRAAAEASRTAARLARVRFDAGAADLLALLDAERQVLSAEDQLAQADTSSASATVAVFKAFGGGWTEAAVQPGPKRQRPGPPFEP